MHPIFLAILMTLLVVGQLVTGRVLGRDLSVTKREDMSRLGFWFGMLFQVAVTVFAWSLAFAW